MISSLNATFKVGALLVLPVLIAAGVLLAGPAGFGPGGPGILADHGTASGQSFTFLEAPFTQEVFGVAPHFIGGVAFAPDGDPWVDDCVAFGSHLHRYDAQGVSAEVNSTKLHPESVVASNAGCGLTNHPDGFMYSNTTGGVVQLDASTGAPTGLPAFGAAGNALGIAPSPANGELVYVGSNGTILTAPVGGASATFSAVTTGNFVDGLFFAPDGKLWLANRSPSFRATVLNPGGTIDRHIPLPSEPDGIAFHSAGGFIVTNNLDGTMSKIVPGPDTVSVFASGGFRGDLSQVGADGCLYLTQDGTRYDDGTVTGENSLVKLCPGFVPPVPTITPTPTVTPTPGLVDKARKLLASDIEADDRFGFSVAISGDFAVVGAQLEDAGGSAAGAAYVLQRNEGGAENWGEVKKLTASDAQAGDQFGYSVAVSGDTVVVGANDEDSAGSGTGAAYVFRRNHGGADNWGEVKKLIASDAQGGDNFGWSVTVSGDTVVVGAYVEDAGGSAAGAAYVFQRNQGGTDNWGEVKKLTASDAETGDLFGISVAVSGDTIVVGAWVEDAGGSDAGAAYVFDLLQPKKLPFPGDTDGDGCPDVRENGLDETLGGLRDYQNPWDWYDVNQDGVIDLLNDILGVIQHYETSGNQLPPYDVLYDRGPTAGPNSWNMTAPDGVIDLLNDILGVILQYSPNPGCT